MAAKFYELIEHTADIGLRVKGKGLEGLFKNTALAMFDTIAERVLSTKDKGLSREILVALEANNLDELFVNWLNELLSLSSAKEIIFSDFQFAEINDKKLKAKAIGKDIKFYKVDVEIKAATYHQLKIKKIADKWQAEVIFDV